MNGPDERGWRPSDYLIVIATLALGWWVIFYVADWLDGLSPQPVICLEDEVVIYESGLPFCWPIDDAKYDPVEGWRR